MKKKEFIALGLMTGTSMDGVDLSLIKSDGITEFTPILNDYYEFDDKLFKSLVSLRAKISSESDLIKFSLEINEIERKLTLFHNKIINKSLENFPDHVDLIGFHGQTIFHNSDKKISKQLGDGKMLSQLTKKIVINNFRNNDLINGGQGAPLTPIFHKLISKSINQNYKISFPLTIINIGGVTNITIINDNKDIEISNFHSYDIAPGNCLIDEWVRLNSDKKIDLDGEIAKSGKVNDLILNQAIDNFNINSYEKSLDIKDFDISFAKGLSFEDGCATITKFSANLIADGIKNVVNSNSKFPIYNFICGGGRKNNFLLKSVKSLLNKEMKLENIDNFGFNGDFIESQTFGYLSIRSYLNLPISFPKTTRCLSPTIGGTINKNF